MENIKLNDYNEQMMILASLLGVELFRYDFISINPKTYNVFGKQTITKEYSTDLQKGRLDYKAFQNESLSNYSLKISDGVNETIIETSEVKDGKNTIPRVHIKTNCKDCDLDNVDFDITPFSIKAAVQKCVDDRVLTRSITFEDHTFSKEKLLTCCTVFDLRKFTSIEQSEYSSKILSVERKGTKSFITIYPDINKTIFPIKKYIATDNYSYDSVINELLAGERSINLFSYVFDTITEAIPGIVDYFEYYSTILTF